MKLKELHGDLDADQKIWIIDGTCGEDRELFFGSPKELLKDNIKELGFENIDNVYTDYIGVDMDKHILIEVRERF